MATARKPTEPHALRDVIGGDRDKEGNFVDAIPQECFGTGRGKLLRKLVLIAIAKSADRDGTNAYPSMETIAHRCMVTVEAVRKTINWLAEHGLLKVESKAVPTSRYGRTNKYVILFPKHMQIEVVGASEERNTTLEERNTTLEGWNTNRKPTMTVLGPVPMTVHEEVEGATSSVQVLAPPILEFKTAQDDEGGGELQDQPSEIKPLETKPPETSPLSSSSQREDFNNKVAAAAPDAPAAPDANAILARVWDYYIKVTGKSPRVNTLTAGRRKLGMARLRDCLARTGGNYDNAGELMKLAIEGIANSDWAMGRDPKTKGMAYCDWERHIFKTEEMMERLWN
jgi:hypothetical protein